MSDSSKDILKSDINAKASQLAFVIGKERTAEFLRRLADEL